MTGLTKAATAAAAVLGMVMTAALTSAPTATAGEEEVPTGGPVTGKIVATEVFENVIGLCASACVTGRDVKFDDEGGHLLDVSKDGVVRSQADAIPTGTYRIAFGGRNYANNMGSFGYLRRTAAGRYQVVKKFENATEFTVVEGEALKLGTLNTRAGWVKAAGSRFYGYGGSWTGLRTKIRAVHFPKGATLLVRTVGCGGKVHGKKAYRKSGKFTVVWDNPKAYKHYGKVVHYKFTLRREGDLDQVWWEHHNWEDFTDWKCN